jgi:hypothetical protein
MHDAFARFCLPMYGKGRDVVRAVGGGFKLTNCDSPACTSCCELAICITTLLGCVYDLDQHEHKQAGRVSKECIFCTSWLWRSSKTVQLNA